MAEGRERKSDSARGGHSYVKDKGLVSFPVLMTPKLRDKIRLAAALTGHKSMSKFAAAALDSAADQAVEDFRRGDGRVPAPGNTATESGSDDPERAESEMDQQDASASDSDGEERHQPEPE
jgi:hypothetical protein